MEELKEVVKALPEVIGSAAAIAIVLLIKTGVAWLKEWIALLRLHLGAETFIKSTVLQNPDVDLRTLLTEGQEFMRKRFPDSVKQVGATPDKLITILESKVVDQAPLAGKIVADRPV